MGVTMPLDRVQVIVEHLLTDGSRDGIILGDELNVAMGASARRRAARALPPLPPLPEGYPKPGLRPEYVHYSHDVGLWTEDGVLTVSCDYCNVRVGTFTEAERTIAERIATEHGGYHR